MRQDMPGFGVSRNGPHEWRNSCHGSEAVRRSGRSPALWLDSLRHLLKPEFGCFRKQVHRHRWFAGIVSVRRWGLQDHNRLLARLSHCTPSILTKFLFSAPDSLLGGDIICISAERTGSICPLSRTCFPRKLRGSALSERTGSSLTLEVLDMVVRCCKPRKSLVFHSNRGILYADSIFREQPESHGILQSLSRKGDPSGNAVAKISPSASSVSCSILSTFPPGPFPMPPIHLLGDFFQCFAGTFDVCSLRQAYRHLGQRERASHRNSKIHSTFPACSRLLFRKGSTPNLCLSLLRSHPSSPTELSCTFYGICTILLPCSRISQLL